MVFLGLGIGMIIQVMVLAVQNAVERRDLGTATATESFIRSMGGAFGVAIFGAILTNRLTYNLKLLLPSGSTIDPDSLTGSPAAIAKLPPSVHDAVIQSLANAIHVVFLAAVPLTIAAFVVTWFLPERPLRETAHVGAAETLVEASAEPMLDRTAEEVVES
jgi:hypothetical protein